MKKLILGLLFVLASAGQALAGQVTLTVGAPVTSGIVAFTIRADDSNALYVQVPVWAGDTGATIAGRIRASVNGGEWSAATTTPGGSTLMFSYSGTPVGEVDCVVDTASASATLSTTAMRPAAVLQIDAKALASGFDAKGGPSYLTFSMTGGAPYTVMLHPGQTATSIMDGIASDLGNLVTRVSPTEILIVKSGLLSVSLQTSDTGLQGALALSEAAKGPTGGLIDRKP